MGILPLPFVCFQNYSLFQKNFIMILPVYTINLAVIVIITGLNLYINLGRNYLFPVESSIHEHGVSLHRCRSLIFSSLCCTFQQKSWTCLSAKYFIVLSNCWWCYILNFDVCVFIAVYGNTAKFWNLISYSCNLLSSFISSRRFFKIPWVFYVDIMSSANRDSFQFCFPSVWLLFPFLTLPH